MDKPYIKLALNAGLAALLWMTGLVGAQAATPPLPANTPTPGQVQSSLPTVPPPPQPKSGPEFSPPAAAPSEVAPGGTFDAAVAHSNGGNWDHPTG